MVFDTEVYSNTGGQSSKSPKTGAYIFDEQMVRNEDVQNFFKK